MMTIPVPTSSVATQEVSIAGVKYTLLFTFNTFDKRWRASLLTNLQEPIINGIKLMENQPLFSSYLDILPDGAMACVRVLDDGLPVGRDNLGFNKPYQLVYVTDEEIEELF